MSNSCYFGGIEIVDKYPIREFTALALDKGVTLCTKRDGAFFTIRYTEELEALKELLNSIEIIKTRSFEEE
jgi:hypothetical protein